MHEHIFAAFIALDEAKAFLAVEKFNDAIAFADNLRGHSAARAAATASTAAETTTAATAAAAEAAATVTAAESAAITAAETTTATTAAAKAAAITAAAAIAALLVEGIDVFFTKTIALIAPTSTAPTTAAVISVETHALNVTFASSLKLLHWPKPQDERDAKPPQGRS